MQNRLEFEQAVEGLFFGALRAHEHPGLKNRLRAAGLDLDHRLAPAYPAEDFYRWVRLSASELFPEVTEDEGCKRIGRLAVERGLESTVLGRALLVVLKMVGIRRTFERLNRSFRNGNNYIEVETIDRGPTALDLRFNTVMGTPGYFEGILEAGMDLFQVSSYRIERRPHEGEGCTFMLRWQTSTQQR